MNKEWLKQVAVQLGVQSVFIAADQIVRTVVNQKLKTYLDTKKAAADFSSDSTK